MIAQADTAVANQAVYAQAVTAFFDGKFTDLFVVTTLAGTNELTSVEFYEKRPDLGEIEILKQVDWGVRIPPDARLFVAASGLLRNHLGAFWVGWQSPGKLTALSVYQDAPLEAPLDTGAMLISPALVVPSKEMIQYFWLPKDKSWSLYKYVFRGNQGERGRVSRERIGQTDLEPSLSAAAPVPGAEDDRSAIAWIQQTGPGARVQCTLLKGDSSETMTTPVIPYITSVPRQRLALHVDAAGTISVGFIEEALSGAYIAMEVRFDFVKHLVNIYPASLRITAGTLHSACMIYFKNQHERQSFVCFLTDKGTLGITTPGSDLVRVVRQQVDLDYDFPILTSLTGRYEAVRTNGQIELLALD